MSTTLSTTFGKLLINITIKLNLLKNVFFMQSAYINLFSYV